MNSLTLALRQLTRRPIQSAINVLVMGLGIAMVTVLLLGQMQFEERLQRDARGIDLVVGTSGSPLQLILASVYHVDIPPGNIPLGEARGIIEREPAVEQVIPVALGDNYAGFRIVGTEPSYIAHYGANLARGRAWEGSMEAVLGAEVARRTGLNVGEEFNAAHGLGQGGHVHDYAPYTVVGVLKYTGSVLDRLILTPVQSVWDVHDHGGHGHDDHGHDDHLDHHEGEITALLVRYASPIAASRLPRQINETTPWQAAEPAFETARLSTMVAPAVAGLQLFAGILILGSLLSVFAVLYQNLRDRRYDFAVMRAIGARRSTVFRLTLIEGVLMVIGGLLAGLVLGHLVTELMGTTLTTGRSIGLTGLAWAPGQTWLVMGVLVSGGVISLLPAWQAARIEPAATLRRGP